MAKPEKSRSVMCPTCFRPFTAKGLSIHLAWAIKNGSHYMKAFRKIPAHDR